MTLLYFMFVSVQASTSLQIRVCVRSVTAIPWELLSAVVRAGPDSVCVPILQWEGGAVTSVARCSLDSTPASAGKMQLSHTRTDEHHICWVCRFYLIY